MQYKVKSLQTSKGNQLQKEISQWIESRNHISITHINIWQDSNIHYCVITYTEKEYVL